MGNYGVSHNLGDKGMFGSMRKKAKWFGLVSLILSALPFVYMNKATGGESIYLDATLIVVAVGGSLLAAVAAALIGSKWWLLALLGPVFDTMFLLSLRT